jgi:hypothetical protein
MHGGRGRPVPEHLGECDVNIALLVARKILDEGVRKIVFDGRTYQIPPPSPIQRNEFFRWARGRTSQPARRWSDPGCVAVSSTTEGVAHLVLILCRKQGVTTEVAGKIAARLILQMKLAIVMNCVYLSPNDIAKLREKLQETDS